MTRRSASRWLLGAVAPALMLASACATRSFQPASPDSVPLRERAQVQRDGKVEVRAAVPGPDETRALFGAPLYDRGIQPVWIEVANGQADWVRFAPVGVDRTYFSPNEVWIGQISRDICVRFTRRTITTHKIDPDIDETREYLLEDLAYAQSLAKFGYVEGVGAAPLEAPRHNLTGDPYFTDGYRLVLWVASESVAMDDIQVVDWRDQPL